MKNKQVGNEKKNELFHFFNELAIIQQLATTIFNKVMPDGLHISHFIAINHLARLGDGATPIQIARSLQLTKATMTHTLSVLQKRGFIETHANPNDGRSKLIHLTPEGRAFQERAILALSPTFELLRGELDTKELILMLPALQKLRALLDDNRK